MDDSFKHEVLLEMLELLPSGWELRGTFICSYAKRDHYHDAVGASVRTLNDWSQLGGHETES